jgi:hypothetical protein
MAAFAGEDGAHGASHRVTHAHDVDPRDATPNVEIAPPNVRLTGAEAATDKTPWDGAALVRIECESP